MPIEAWAAIVVAAAVAISVRRKKKLLVVVFALLMPFAARAELDRAPRRWLFAAKIDRYDPQVDSEKSLAGATPYHDIFHGRAPVRWQGEVQWEALHPFGTLLVGVTGGFWQNIGKGLYAEDVPSLGKKAGDQSTDTALLNVIPFSAVVTYRFDWLTDRLHWFPVIPYAQAGLSAALWVAKGGSGSVAKPAGGGRGSGWSTGYTTAAGVAVPLDTFTPGIANEGYRDLGLQRTSLFAEYGWTRLDGFRNGKTLILSDRAWRFGLSLEF